VRIANLSGRLVLVTADGTAAVDVEQLSGGRFTADPQAVYPRWDEFSSWASAADLSSAQPFAVEDLGAPAPTPRQVLAIGLNYSEHAAESGFQVPDAPTVMFTKWASCLAGPSPQFSLGKSLPGFGPTGPWLVTPDELDDRDDLELGCSINGDQMQKGRTRELIFSVPAMIAKHSSKLPLLPGDVLFTGKPAGVGLGRNPQRWLAAGDELVSYITGIGELRQRFISASSAPS